MKLIAAVLFSVAAVEDWQTLAMMSFHNFTFQQSAGGKGLGKTHLQNL